MIHTAVANTTEFGLPLSTLSWSCANVFARVLYGGRPPVTRCGPGWAAVANHATALHEADLGSVTIPDLAAMLRKAYARGMDAAGGELPWEEVPPLTRLAWETVARHAAWAVASADAPDRLAANEDARAALAERELTSRGIKRA
jgi:hypothetical protein